MVPSSPIGSIYVDLDKLSMPDDDVDSSLDTEAKPLQHGEPSSTQRTFFNTANPLQHGEPSSTRRTLRTKPSEPNPPNQKKRRSPSAWISGYTIGEMGYGNKRRLLS